MSLKILDDLLQCNRSELHQLCIKAGLVVSPKLSREDLAKTLVGVLEEGTENPLDPWRHGLATFVLKHWTVLQNQITCPLKSKDPLSCFGCLDAQVITCLNDNDKYISDIQLLKKSRTIKNG